MSGRVLFLPTSSEEWWLPKASLPPVTLYRIRYIMRMFKYFNNYFDIVDGFGVHCILFCALEDFFFLIRDPWISPECQGFKEWSWFKGPASFAKSKCAYHQPSGIHTLEGQNNSCKSSSDWHLCHGMCAYIHTYSKLIKMLCKLFP